MATSTATPAIETIQQWHDALNAGESERLMALVHPQVEVGGPRGSSRGAHTLLDWVDRAQVRLLPQRWFDGGNQVVVQELGEWRMPGEGQGPSSQVVATVFRVDENGIITRIARHDGLAAALEDVCLSLEDEVEID